MLIKTLIYKGLSLFGEAFGDPKLSWRTLAKHVLIQKVLRVNSHVSWPVHWTSQVKCPERIQKGTRFPGLAMGCYLDGRNGIIIGRNTWIGPRVSIISMNHDKYNYNTYVNSGPVVMGDNCWLATNVVILPGVRLGNHVICAAGAVVTKSFEEDNIVLAGVPARIVRRIEPYDGDSSVAADAC